MSFTYGFFNSFNHDRRYNAEQLSDMFSGVINDGVFGSVGEHYAVKSVGGMNVTVGTGRSWFNGIWTMNDTEYPLIVDTSELVLNRIDAVVIEVNKKLEERAVFLKTVKGAPAIEPQKPTLINTEDVHQHPLAYITVEKQVTAIRDADIEIVVGTSECPFVTSILEITDVDALWVRWQDSWERWFENKKETTADSVMSFENSSMEQFNLWFETIKSILSQEPTGAVLAKLGEIECLVKNSNEYSIPASKWVEESPNTGIYVQTIKVQGITDATMLDFAFVPPSEFVDSVVRKYSKHCGFIKKYKTSNNSIAFYCINKVPEVDIKIRIRGY